MRKELLERRTEMWRLHLKGIELPDIVNSISEKFAVDADSLSRDWRRREKWISQIIQLNDPTLLHTCLDGARAILQKAWLLALESDNDFVRLGALRLIKDTNLSLLERLESAGIVQRAPVQIEQRILVIKGQWWRQQTAEPQLTPVPTA